MLNYIEARKIAVLQHPIRRPVWPADHHLRNHEGEAGSMLKLHTPDSPEAAEWRPSYEDEAAQDWEQYLPQVHPVEAVEEGQEE